MKLYPLTVIEFQDAFPTDRACFEYLWLIKWQDGFKCRSCGHDEAWKISTKNSSRCKKCKKQTSITSGTIFQDRHIPLRLIFQAIWYVVSNKQGVSALGLQSVLGFGSYRTAWSWLHKLRRAMIRPGRDKLSGIVEVDETLVGGSQSGKRGRGAEGKELVLVCIEDKGKKGLGRVRLKHIPNASGNTLLEAIKELVEPRSTIRTDGWKGYNSLKKNGYEHIILKHNEVEPGEDPTPKVHRIASLLKRWLFGTHQGGQQFSHIQYYLDEYTFRFNRRKSKSRGKLFYRLIQQSLEVDPNPFETLKASTSSL
jgi:transposase-like protein